MTLLMNKDKALPIRRETHLAVIGPYVDYGAEQGGKGGKLSDELVSTHAIVLGSIDRALACPSWMGRSSYSIF